MSEINVQAGERKTVAVTIVGGFFLALGIILLFGVTLFFTVKMNGDPGYVRIIFATTQGTIGLLYGYVGLATVSRWRGWGAWLSATAWGMIAVGALELVQALNKAFHSASPQPDPGLKIIYVTSLVLVAMAAIALLAKRRERHIDSR